MKKHLIVSILLYSTIYSIEHISSFYPNGIPEIVKYFKNTNSDQIELVKEVGYYDNGNIKYNVIFNNKKISKVTTWDIGSVKSKNISIVNNHKVVGSWKFNVNEIKIKKIKEMQKPKDEEKGLGGLGDFLSLPFIDIFGEIKITFTMEGDIYALSPNLKDSTNDLKDLRWIYKKGDYFILDKKNNTENIIRLIDNNTMVLPDFFEGKDFFNESLYRYSFYY